jgi:acyl-CoA reductase-like NAD-dependent aldehyde dehydrogenase
MAMPAVVFGAVGTAGQRCTSTRRLIVHESIYDKVKESLTKAYGGLKLVIHWMKKIMLVRLSIKMQLKILIML